MLVQIATLFGVGRIPKAPGTWGSLATLPLCLLLMKLGFFVYMAATLGLTILAIAAAEHYERQSDKHDSKEIVIDEMAGMLVTMTWLPMTWQSFVIGFLVFRFLDILKPFPISYFDKKVPGGFGVVADDLVAGILGNILLQLMLHHTAWLGVQIQNFG
jgi:phosphatidylglycerophosphatase A